MRRVLLATGIGTLTLAAAACGSTSYSPTAPTASLAPPAGAMTIDISGVKGLRSFSPNPTQLPWGQLVVWHNTDTVTHRVVLDDGELDTGTIAPGAFSRPFSLVSPRRYHCSIHPAMIGMFVTVE